MAYRVFDTSHTAVNISNIIRTILEEYRLLHRVFSISFDNTSNNTTSIRDLVSQCQPTLGTKYFHIQCACHILNLCVKDGLVVLHDLIEPIKYVVSHMCNTPIFKPKVLPPVTSDFSRPKSPQAIR